MWKFLQYENTSSRTQLNRLAAVLQWEIYIPRAWNNFVPSSQFWVSKINESILQGKFEFCDKALKFWILFFPLWGKYIFLTLKSRIDSSWVLLHVRNVIYLQTNIYFLYIYIVYVYIYICIIYVYICPLVSVRNWFQKPPHIPKSMDAQVPYVK